MKTTCVPGAEDHVPSSERWKRRRPLMDKATRRPANSRTYRKPLLRITASAGKTWEKKRCNLRSKKGLLFSNVKAEMPSDTKWDLEFWSEAAVAAPVKRSVFLARLLTA